MTTPNDETREVTYFDFKNVETRERLFLWLDLTTAKIHRGESLSQKDNEKVAELLNIIIREEEYKIPRKQGEKKKQDKGYERLVCWYKINLERKYGLSPTEAKYITADRFCTGIKTIESYSTKHKKEIEKFIDQCGFDEVSAGFKHRLSFIKMGTPLPQYES